MGDKEIYCFFQGEKKILPLINDYNAFIAKFIKEFNLEERGDYLEFYIYSNNIKKKILNNKYFYKYFFQENINEVYCEDNNIIDESTPNDSNLLLLKKISELEKFVGSLSQKNNNLKEKCEESEQKLKDLENKFESYKKKMQNDISDLQSQILNIDDINITDSSRNSFLNSKVSKHEDIEDTPKPIKRGKKTPKGNDDFNYENEKPINRNRTPMDNNDNNMNYEYNKKQNSFQKSNIKNSGTEYSDTYNKEYENNDNFITSDSGINSKYLNNNKSINNSNDNYNTKINNNSKNNFKNNTFESKKKSKIETPNESIKINKNHLSCEFIISPRIPSKLKSSVKKTLSVPLSFELKNNGQVSIPEQAKIQYDNEGSDLMISDIYINNGKELKPNQKIPIKLQAYFKDQNNIKTKIYKIKLYLYHKQYGKIGNDGLIQIQILDESVNIIENSKNRYKNKNENDEFEKNEQESYRYRDSNNYYQNQYE